MKEAASPETGAHCWLKDLEENEQVRGCYLVKEKRLGTTRRGEPFLSLILADRSGEVEAKIWDNAEEISNSFSEGNVLQVEGATGSYRGKIQLTLTSAARCGEEFDTSMLVESSPFPAGEMLKTLREILHTIKNRHLRALADRFLADKDFVTDLKRAPAAKNFHHGYLGGLLEHTLGVCKLARTVASMYPSLDEDLLVFGAFVHDIGKIRELKCSPVIDYTDEGRLIGHLVLGVRMVEEKIRTLKEFPSDLEIKVMHLILSHHGEYEFGSPKRPKFLEAFALHLLDDLDAKINGLGRFIEQDRQKGSWTEFNRLFTRFLLKGEPEVEQPSGNAPPEPSQGTLFL
jgi:3'-5' exoribonuclease